jgi:putative Mg2+ transporter-C (MgtC) family protein
VRRGAFPFLLWWSPPGISSSSSCSLVVVRLPESRWIPSGLRVSYEDGRGILREILVVCTRQDFAVGRLRVERGTSSTGDPEDASEMREPDLTASAEQSPSKGVVTVVPEVQGTRSVAKLAARLAEIGGVVSVNAADVNLPSD